MGVMNQGSEQDVLHVPGEGERHDTQMEGKRYESRRDDLQLKAHSLCHSYSIVLFQL